MIVFLQKPEQIKKKKSFWVSGEDEAEVIEAFSTITALLTQPTLITKKQF